MKGSLSIQIARLERLIELIHKMNRQFGQGRERLPAHDYRCLCRLGQGGARALAADAHFDEKLVGLLAYIDNLHILADFISPQKHGQHHLFLEVGLGDCFGLARRLAGASHGGDG